MRRDTFYKTPAGTLPDIKNINPFLKYIHSAAGMNRFVIAIDKVADLHSGARQAGCCRAKRLNQQCLGLLFRGIVRGTYYS